MTTLDARQVSALVVMSRLLVELGFGVNRRARRCACIIHNGSNPSAFAWTDSGLWRCHSCERGGDKIALVREVRHCSFREAVEFLAALAGVEYRPRLVFVEHSNVKSDTANGKRQRPTRFSRWNSWRGARHEPWCCNLKQFGATQANASRRTSRRAGTLDRRNGSRVGGISRSLPATATSSGRLQRNLLRTSGRPLRVCDGCGDT